MARISPAHVAETGSHFTLTLGLCAGLVYHARALPQLDPRSPAKDARSTGRLSASAPSHHSLFSAAFITNTAESDFRYTQVKPGRAEWRTAKRTGPELWKRNSVLRVFWTRPPTEAALQGSGLWRTVVHHHSPLARKRRLRPCARKLKQGALLFFDFGLAGHRSASSAYSRN